MCPLLVSSLLCRMQMSTYNHASVAFGYFSAVFDWLDSGLIEMTFHVAVGWGGLRWAARGLGWDI